MKLLYSFLICGLFCLIAELILDNTKLTPGHITSLFVFFGAFLSFIGVYEPLVNICGAGANLPIISFGNLLYQGAIKYNNLGIIGIFKGLLIYVSAGISATIVFSFIFALIVKTKK